MRVLSYNVRSLRDDRSALARVVRACAPDVVCVQEAPRFPLGRRATVRWARDCRLRLVCGGRRTHGPALLARPGLVVAEVAEHAFPRTPGLHARGLAVARVDGVVVASMHLGLTPEERVRNGRQALRALAGAPAGPLVLAGDLNEEPGGPAWRLFESAALSDACAPPAAAGAPTFPARSPVRRIDAVLVSESMAVLACEVPGLPEADLVAATDHLPVLADVVRAG